MPKNCRLSWLFHNHRVYSGNVPSWADWVWPDSAKYKLGKFQAHFYFLLLGQHPSWGGMAVCRRVECVGNNSEHIYRHHFFECENFTGNRSFFCSKVRQLFKESEAGLVPFSMVENILLEPCGMWVGLMSPELFSFGLKLKTIHELHRICIMASILSWGRFYGVPCSLVT